MLSKTARLGGALLLAAGGLTAMIAVSNATAAATTKDTPLCTGWYVNPDELDRAPTQKWNGMEFKGDDLIHHTATGTVADLAAGTFVAAPAPDQPSFFSVEVRNGDGTGYATLRWNTDTLKWNMVTGGQFYENATAAGVVAMTTPPKSSTLLSFGVGYTKNPPGTVTTLVKSVTFKGTKYELSCKPAQSSSSSGSASASASGSSSSKPPTQSSTSQPPTASASSTSAAPSASGSTTTLPTPGGNTGGGSLPKTGSAIPMAMITTGGVGLVLLGAGLLAILWFRRRREEPVFEA